MRARRTLLATPGATLRVALAKAKAGSAFITAMASGGAVAAGQCIEIMTRSAAAVPPEGADAVVVMVEHAQVGRRPRHVLERAAERGQNIVPRGR